VSDPKKIFETMKENDVKYVDYRFTDPRAERGLKKPDILV